MKQDIKAGQVDYSVLVYIPDAASTDGSGKTGLVAANLTVSYTRVETDNDVVVTDVTSSLNNLALLTTAHTDWGLLEVSNTLAPGLYRLDLADAVLASGAWSAVVYVMVTTSAASASPMEFLLRTNDPHVSVEQTGDGYAIANSGTHGQAALKTIIDTKASQASLDTLDNFVDGEVASILAAVDTEMAAVLALLDDARTEPGQGAPPVNPDLATKIDYIYKSWRNKKDNDGTVTTLYADDGSTADQKQTTSEAAGTVTKGEWITGA